MIDSQANSEGRDAQRFSAWQATFGADRDGRLGLGAGWIQFQEERSNDDLAAAIRRWHDPAVATAISSRAPVVFLALEQCRLERLSSIALPGMARNLSKPRCQNGMLDAQLCCCELISLVMSGEHDALPSRIAYWAGRLAKAIKPAGPLTRMAGLIGVGYKALGARIRADLSDALLQLEALPVFDVATLSDQAAFQAHTEAWVLSFSRFLESEGLLPDSSPGSNLSRSSESSFLDDQIDQSALDDDPFAETDETRIFLAETTSMYEGYAIFDASQDLLVRPVSARARFDRDGFLDESNPERKTVRREALRLRRLLMSSVSRKWAFDLTEGRIDPRRLSSLVKQSADPRIFRQETVEDAPFASISLLVDLSGSMLGDEIRFCALAIDYATQVLEAAGFETEVLGFSTRYGGKLRNPIYQAWREQGDADSPGRLNALKHTVFKFRNQKWGQSRSNLIRMLEIEPGKQNVDGEALHWAASRLATSKARKKLLFVFSDGVPYDEATADANGRGFLESHLRDVVKQVECSGIELVALGMKTSLFRFYSNVIYLRSPQDVASGLFDSLAKILVGNHGCMRSQ